MDHPPATIRGGLHGSGHLSPAARGNVKRRVTAVRRSAAGLPAPVARGIVAAWPSNRTAHRHPPPPDAASLREAALKYLARYATTEAGLRQVLHRRIDLWARQAAGEDDAPRTRRRREGHRSPG